MSWSWLHRLGSPKYFYYAFQPAAKWLFWFGLTLFMVALIWGLAFAPEDYQQGNSFRIMYVHVPSAMFAQGIYFSLGLAALVAFVWRIKMSPIYIQAVAPLGALMTACALVTGAIWGKPTWGTWWVWDARLTSMLVLFLLYVGLMAIHNTLEDRALADRAAGAIALLGMVNLPIIKYSVEWWNTLHQPASFSLTSKPTMPIDMWLPLLISALGLMLLLAGLAIWRMQTHILMREKRSHWVQKEGLQHGI
ncbi:heme ABC transporter permease CcmC [Marinomonas epiphytica]